MVEAEPLECSVKLEPRQLGSPEGFELLKILDNTVAVYRQLHHRATQEIRSGRRLESLAGLRESALGLDAPGDASEDVNERDEELALYETELFEVADGSDRQLYLNHLREETDLFLIFADWAEKQRRKLTDPRLRNSNVWEAVDQMKSQAVSELAELNSLIQMLKNPPSSGTAPGVNARATEANRQRCRQMVLVGAMNQADPKDELDEALLCVEKRRVLLEGLSSSLQKTRRLLKSGRKEQVAFLFLVKHLCAAWNVSKVPYETQVFNAADSNYPYRGELWIEALPPIPPDCWGADILEDPNVNMAVHLWQAADDAGYKPRSQEEQSLTEGGPQDGKFTDTQGSSETLVDWKEKRVRRRFGHPYFCAPPVPISSPFEASWVELYVMSQADEEKLPPSAAKLILGEDENSESQEESESESVKEKDGGINIVVRLKGDAGAYVRERRHLRCEISVKSVRWAPWKSEEIQHELTGVDIAKETDAELHDESVAEPHGGDIEQMGEDMSEDLKYSVTMANEGDAQEHARAAFENVNNFLTVVQRTCIERAIFAIIQGQATRMLREMTYPLIDDESLTAIKDRLRSSAAKIETLGDLALLLKPSRFGEESTGIVFGPDLHPANLPASWLCWPINASPKGMSPLGALPANVTSNPEKGRFNYLITRKLVTVVFSDSDTVSFTMHSVPLLGSARKFKGSPRIIGVTDLLVTVSFASQKVARQEKKLVGTTDDKFDMQFRTVLRGLEELSVCKLRQLFVEILEPMTRTNPLTQCDLFRLDVPSIRSSKGPALFNNFHSWLIAHTAMSVYTC